MAGCLAPQKTRDFQAARAKHQNLMMAEQSPHRDRGFALQSGRCVRSELAWAGGGDFRRAGFPNHAVNG